MKLGDVMDEIAVRLRQAPSLAGRTFAYPPATVTPPAAIVSYPSAYTFDATYGRGSDEMTGTVVVVVGNPTARPSRDALTKYLDGSGPESVKELVDGDDYVACDGVRVTGADFDVYSIGGTDYLTAVFQLDIAGPGTA